MSESVEGNRYGIMQFYFLFLNVVNYAVKMPVLGCFFFFFENPFIFHPHMEVNRIFEFQQKKVECCDFH